MKLFKQALSLALSVLLVASALFVGVSAEDLTKTVNATALDVVTYNSARNATVGNPLYIESFKAGNDNNPLVPELSSDRFTFTWDKENNSLKSDSLAEFSADASMSDSKIYTLYEYQPLSLDLTKDKASQLIEINGENSGLMFYISLGNTTSDTVLFIENQVYGFDTDGNIYTAEDKNGATVAGKGYATSSKSGNPYYLLQAGGVNWEAKTVKDKLGVGNKKGSYGITLPAGYEGFVYLPKDSYLVPNKGVSLDTYNYLARTDFYVNNLSSANTVEVSNIMIVDGDVTTADVLKVGDKSYNFEYDGFYSFDDLNVSGVDVSYDGYYGFTNKDGQLALGYGADDSSLSVKMDADKSGVISLDSCYTTIPLAVAENVARDQRPKTASNWAPIEVTKVSGDNLKYKVALHAPDPFGKGGFNRDDETVKIANLTFGDQYDEMFAQNGAYIGGFNRSIATTTSNLNDFYASAYSSVSKDIVVTNKGIMFYIKHNYEVGVTEKKSVNIVPMLKYFYTVSGKPYYVYDSSSKIWCKAEFNAPAEGMKSSLPTQKDICYGYIKVPVDFEGWYVIPYDSFVNSDKELPTKVDEFKLTFDCFGKEYGDIVFGNITVVDNFNPMAVASGSVFASTNNVALPANFPFKTVNAVATKVVGDSLYRNTFGKITGFSVAKNGLVGTYTANPETFAPSIDENGVYTAAELSRLEYQVNGANANTAGYSAFAIRVDNTNGGDITAIVGTNYIYMNAGSTYYLMSDDKDTWEANETTADTWTMKIGTEKITEKSGVSAIEIDSDFVGWLCIPFESYKSSFTTMARFDFFPVTMSGSVSFSDFTLLSATAPLHYVDKSAVKGMNENIESLLDVYDPAKAGAVTIADGVLTNESDALYAAFKANGTVTKDESLMFYAKNGSEVDVSFKIDGFNMADARAYDKDFRDWAGNGPEATEVILRAGFEGWVRVPVSENYEFSALRFIFSSLADGFEVSDFMVANRAGNSDYMRRGTTYKTPLFYMTGDFNEDGNVDVLDLVYNKKNPEVKFDIMKFEGDQQTALRFAILGL